MATVEPVITQDFIRNRSRHVFWSGLTQGDKGGYVSLAGHQDKTVHVFGTYASATVTIYGSNDPRVETDPDNASWVVLKGADGLDLTSTSDAVGLIVENPVYICCGVDETGTGADVTVAICARIV